MATVPFAEFQKLDLRVGTIRLAERLPDSEKLLRLEVDFGGKQRQIVAGLGKTHAPESLTGRQCVCIVNLEPRPLLGLISEGMVLAATDPEGRPVLLQPEKEIPAGAGIR